MNIFHKAAFFKNIINLAKVNRVESYSYLFCLRRRVCHPTVANLLYSPTKRRLFSSDKRKRNILPLLVFSIPFFGRKEEEEEEEDQLITILKHGILATMKEDYNKAEQLFHIGLKVAQERLDDQAITYIFDLMANLAFKRDELEKAEKLFKSVLKRLIADGMSLYDNAIVEISLKLAKICSKKGDYEDALEGFRFCISTQEEKVSKASEESVDEDTLALLAMSREWCGEFLMKFKEYKLARENFSKSYDVCVNLKGPESCHSAIILNNLGTVEVNDKNFSEGISFIRKAIGIGKKAEDCNKHLSSFYTNLGLAFLMNKEKQEARSYCKEGLKLAKKNKNTEAINESLQCLNKVKLEET